MYSSYPFQVQINIRNEQELEERIAEIKALHREGISFKKFHLLVTNLSNGEAGRKSNESKNLTEWKQMFDRVNQGEEISEDDIKNFFDYLQKNHTMMIRNSGQGKYSSLNRRNIGLDEGFQLEYIIYKTIESV